MPKAKPAPRDEPPITFEVELSADLYRSLRQYLDSHDQDFNQFMAQAIQHFLDPGTPL